MKETVTKIVSMSVSGNNYTVRYHNGAEHLNNGVYEFVCGNMWEKIGETSRFTPTRLNEYLSHDKGLKIELCKNNGVLDVYPLYACHNEEWRYMIEQYAIMQKYSKVLRENGYNKFADDFEKSLDINYIRSQQFQFLKKIQNKLFDKKYLLTKYLKDRPFNVDEFTYPNETEREAV